MKLKWNLLLPSLAFLVLITYLSFIELKDYVDEVLKRTGYYVSLEKEAVKPTKEEVEKENQIYRKNEAEYQKILENENLNSPIPETKTPKSLSLYARSAVLLDGDSHRVLYEENGYTETAMASTTKIMTCIIALEYGKPEDVVTVSKYASTMPDVQLNIKPGQQFYLKDLLYSLMLESHNDVAVAVAEHIGGSVEGFAKLMNMKAKELGCNHTNFVTPNGLDAPEHYTTARDLAVIAAYAIKNEEFIKITNEITWTLKEITKGTQYQVANKNRFLYMMEGAIGVKTGFTNMAGYCFVGALKRDDRTFISVVLGSGWPPNKTYKWADTKTLMNYGINHYQFRQIAEEFPFEQIPVYRGISKYAELSMDGNICLLLREDEEIDIKYELPKTLSAPIKENMQVGSANYYINGELYQSIPIYSTTGVEKINFRYCWDTILKWWMMQEEVFEK